MNAVPSGAGGEAHAESLRLDVRAGELSHCGHLVESVNQAAMASTASSRRRTVVLGLAAVLASGCGIIERPRRVNDQGQFCYRPGRSRNLTCTPVPVPPEQVEVEVKRFEPEPNRLTVLVVRNRWADVSDPIDFRVEGHAPVTTVPESLVWLRLEPGRHQLALSWNGADVDTTVEGGAGDVRFVEIVGSAWAWGRSYTWMADDEAGARKRALASRLIAVREDSR